MPDKAVELLEQIVDQRLKDMTQELHNLSVMIEGYLSSQKKDMQLSERVLGSLKTAQTTLAPQRFLSGRWPLRDGYSYGIVASQPALKISEPESGDSPPGDIRPLNVS